MMDKSWMTAQKWTEQYVKGVQAFMEFVADHMGKECEVRCPCINCLNLYIKSQDVVHNHLLIRGMDADYTRWIFHGEHTTFKIPRPYETFYHHDDVDDDSVPCNDIDEDDGVHEMLNDFGNFVNNYHMDHNNGVSDLNGNDGLQDVFTKLLRDAERELYLGCSKFSTLSFLVKLLHLKVYNKWSNKSFDMLLKLLKEALPEGETLPKSHYEARNVLHGLGLGYEAIHACKYDCALFWKEFENHEECPVCCTSRWKINDGKGKKVPYKILHYFLLKPRLQRLFMSKETALEMRWHKDKCIDDGKVLRHPADSETWKMFDNDFSWFAADPRNVRLGLATDGFNPFGNMSTSYIACGQLFWCHTTCPLGNA